MRDFRWVLFLHNCCHFLDFHAFEGEGFFEGVFSSEGFPLSRFKKSSAVRILVSDNSGETRPTYGLLFFTLPLINPNPTSAFIQESTLQTQVLTPPPGHSLTNHGESAFCQFWLSTHREVPSGIPKLLPFVRHSGLGAKFSTFPPTL